MIVGIGRSRQCPVLTGSLVFSSRRARRSAAVFAQPRVAVSASQSLQVQCDRRLLLVARMEDIKLEQDVASVDAPPPPPAQEIGRGKSSKGASGGSGGGGKKRKGRKGLLVCIGCGEQKPVSEFSLRQVVDVECKRFLDRIYHQARVQGQFGVVSQTAGDTGGHQGHVGLLPVCQHRRRPEGEVQLRAVYSDTHEGD